MKKGFTLIEMVLAMGIMGIILVSFILSVAQFSKMNETSENLITALNEARSRLDSARNLSLNDLTGARNSCGTETLSFNESVPGVGRVATISVYFTCLRDNLNNCTDNIFKARAAICWRQSDNWQVGTLLGANCNSSPVEVTTAFLAS